MISSRLVRLPSFVADSLTQVQNYNYTTLGQNSSKKPKQKAIWSVCKITCPEMPDFLDLDEFQRIWETQINNSQNRIYLWVLFSSNRLPAQGGPDLFIHWSISTNPTSKLSKHSHTKQNNSNKSYKQKSSPDIIYQPGKSWQRCCQLI